VVCISIYTELVVNILRDLCRSVEVPAQHLGTCNASKPWAQKVIYERFDAVTPPYLIDGVILLSAHPTCKPSPASFLAGGDYDGDEANVNAFAPLVSALGHSRYDAGLIAELHSA